MSCCGRLRTSIASSHQNARAERAQHSAVSSTRRDVLFEYYGATGLTAVGPVTRRRYRFERAGARIAVDSRDAVAVAAIPNLRRLNQP